VGSEIAHLFRRECRSIAGSSGTSALPCTSASVLRVFADGFMRQPRREAELKDPPAAEDLLSIDGNAATELGHVTAQTGRSASWRRDFD
jgi:hypothetical protein